MRRYGAVSRQGDPESPSPWPAPVPAPAPAVEWNTALFYDYEVADDLQAEYRGFVKHERKTTTSNRC